MPMPLEGVRVLDWRSGNKGRVLGDLGDLGADVIKIEERSAGTPGGMLRLAGLEMSDRPNFYFAQTTGTSGITLD